MHVILANGAPFSGKDTLVKNLLERYPTAIWVRFKDCLYTDSYSRLFPTNEINFEDWVDICNNVKLKDKALPVELTKENIHQWSFNILVNGLNPNDNYHKFKMCYINDVHDEDDITFTRLNKSPREELIYQSENIIKVEHGEGGVAVRTALKIIEDAENKGYNYEDRLYIFSDGGFNIEVQTLMDVLKIERNDLTVIRIDAEGCTFEGDSREYILNPDYTIFNDKTVKFFDTVTDVGIYEKFDTMVLQEKPFDFTEVYCYIENCIEGINIIVSVEHSINGEETYITGDKLIARWFKSLDWNKSPLEYDYFKIRLPHGIFKYKMFPDGYLYESIVNL